MPAGFIEVDGCRSCIEHDQCHIFQKLILIPVDLNASFSGQARRLRKRDTKHAAAVHDEIVLTIGPRVGVPEFRPPNNAYRNAGQRRPRAIRDAPADQRNAFGDHRTGLQARLTVY